MWEYENLDHRAQIRANLAADPIWISDYVSHLIPMLQQQINSVVIEPEWAASLINLKKSEKNIYLMEELETEVDADFVKNSKHFQKGRLVTALHDDIGTNNKSSQYILINIRYIIYPI